MSVKRQSVSVPSEPSEKAVGRVSPLSVAPTDTKPAEAQPVKGLVRSVSPFFHGTQGEGRELLKVQPVPPSLTITEVLNQVYGHSIPREQAMRPGSTAAQGDADRTAAGSDAQSDATPFTMPSLPTYNGGKAADGTIQRLINLIPPHDRFVSLFLGNCAVMRHKRPARSNVGIEKDENIAQVWHREGPQWCNVVCGDAFAWLDRENYTLRRRDFIFVDPPYENATGTRRGHYGHGFTTDQHIELLARLATLPCMVMVCSLPNLLYEHQLTGWRTMQYRNKTRQGMQVEQVWMNYQAPKRLHDYRYLGDNMRERERIKRLHKSRARLLNAMPMLERIALLEHLNRTVKR